MFRCIKEQNPYNVAIVEIAVAWLYFLQCVVVLINDVHKIIYVMQAYAYVNLTIIQFSVNMKLD